ncbi:unnamed protein product, partial [Polarella glacialis]
EDDAASLGSDASLGEQLPSEEEADVEDTPGGSLPSPSRLIFANQAPNPIAWMRLKVGERLLRPMYLEIFSDLYPSAAAAFVAFCTVAREADAPGYAGTQLHRIVSGVAAQGGDLEAELPSGSRSMLDESSLSSGIGALSHSRAGLLSVAVRGADADGVRFSLTLGAAARMLDARQVVLGQVLGSSSAAADEEEAELHPLRHIEAAGSSNGKPRVEVTLQSCGLCDETQRAGFEAFLAAAVGPETEQERYSRSDFSFPPLRDVISQGNAAEVLAFIARDVDDIDALVQAAEAEAQPSMESGTSSQVFHRCEQLEVELTRVLQLLDEVDFRAEGEVRSDTQRVQGRIRQMSAKLTAAKAWTKDGETEAYVQRS